MGKLTLSVALFGIMSSIAVLTKTEVDEAVYQEPVKPMHRPIQEKAENFATPSVPTILRNASAAYKRVTTLQANFVQQRQNPLLGSNTTSKGTISQKKPRYFLLKFSQPAGDVIVSDGTSFWVYYPSADKRQVIRAPISSAGPSGADLQAQFLGDPVRKFQSTFNGIESVGGRKAYVLTLVPRETQGYKSLKVWVDAKDWLARRFVVTESNGVVQDFTLSNLTVNAPINSSVFRFTPPPDARIVERP